MKRKATAKPARASEIKTLKRLCEKYQDEMTLGVGESGMSLRLPEGDRLEFAFGEMKVETEREAEKYGLAALSVWAECQLLSLHGGPLLGVHPLDVQERLIWHRLKSAFDEMVRDGIEGAHGHFSEEGLVLRLGYGPDALVTIPWWELGVPSEGPHRSAAIVQLFSWVTAQFISDEDGG